MQEIENVLVAEDVLVRDKSRGLAATAVRFVALLAVAIFAPALGVQAVTGTLVNATLFIAAAWLGIGGAVLIGIIPSVVSSVTGLLPAALWAMVPFIILSNVLLIVSFSALGKKSYWQGMVAASVLKFALLSAVSSLLIGYFVSEKVAAKIALMMSWPQLFTALSGGILAAFVLGVLGKAER